MVRGYDSIRRDRTEGNGGGCIIFVKQGMQYRVLEKGKECEMIVIEVWTKDGVVKIVNLYNPCKKLSLELLEEVVVHLEGKVVWCGDFNAHSTPWGSYNDGNGEVTEEIMEIKNLVCLNDGYGTRINVKNNSESAIDLTLVSETMAGNCNWESIRDTTKGSDHYPIKIEVGVTLEEIENNRLDGWAFCRENLSRYVIEKCNRLI